MLKIALTRSKPASHFEKNKSAFLISELEQDIQNGKHFHEVFDKLFDTNKMINKHNNNL